MSITEDKELMYATAMANPKFRGAVRGKIKNLEWSSRMATSVLDFFCQPELDGQPFVPRALYAHMSENFIKTEITDVLNLCMEVTQSFREDINNQYTNTMLKTFKTFYQTRMVQAMFKEAEFDPEKIVDQLTQLKDFGDATIPMWNMADLDVDEVQAEDSGAFSTVPSMFQFVRDANAPFDGYSTGQVCMICAPPGVGKTLFLAHEVVAMMRANRKLDENPEGETLEEIEAKKVKVWWLAAGDMTRYDFICRLTAIHKEIPLNDVRLQTKLHYTDDIKDLLKYVEISVVPASYVDAFGVKHFVDTQLCDKVEPNVIIIDYDANLITSHGTDMYRAGEEVYNIATSMARPVGKPGRLVFVASQPKINFWDAPLIPKEAAAESSRKQAIIDMMITIGKNPSCQNDHAGIFHVAKMRRGKEGIKEYYKLLDGRFHIVEQLNYVGMQTHGNNGSSSYKKANNTQQKGWLPNY